jgi:hypothetical protein
MKRLFIFLFLVFPLSAFAVQLGDNLEVVGFLKNEVWLRNNLDNSHQSLTSLNNTADLAMEYTFSDNWALFFHPRYHYDFAYGMRDPERFDRNQEIMGHTSKDEWVRDCYLDYTSDNLDVRLGKQQVVWGTMDVPILDIVMPLDLRQWFIPDMADIRMPLWMGKFEYSPWVNSTAQLLIIPDFEQSQVGPPGSPLSVRSYDLFHTFLTQTIPNTFAINNAIVRYESPPGEFDDSTFGFRWRSMIGDLEYTLNWLSGYSRSAYTYYDSANTVAFPAPVPFNMNFTRRHKRIQASGFSLAKTFVNPGPFEGITLKGEFVYIQGEPTYYGFSGTRAATESSDKYNWGFALEKSIVTNWLVSFQFLQFIIDRETFSSVNPASGLTGNWHAIDPASYGVLDKVENYYILKVMTDFMHERLKPEITIVYGDDNQGRITPKVSFELRDNIWLELGYVHFFGSPDMSNGEFRNRDQMMFEVKTTF